MTLLIIISIGLLTIILSELTSRGKILYTRFINLAVLYMVSTIVILALVSESINFSIWDYFTLSISPIPIILAWIGLRIHLSNSVSLNLLSLLEEGSKSYNQLKEDYNVKKRISDRVDELKTGNYISSDDDEYLVNNLKSKLVLALIRFLRPSG